MARSKTRKTPDVLNTPSGDRAWDALLAASLTAMNNPRLAPFESAAGRLELANQLTARDIVAFTPSPTLFALLQKTRACQEWCDELFDPEPTVNRRDIAQRSPEEWPAAPFWFAMYDGALAGDPAAHLTPANFAKLASLALTPYRADPPETPYSIFQTGEANSKMAQRATSFSRFCESFFRACYLDACRLTGEAPAAPVAYPDLAAEIGADAGCRPSDAHWLIAKADWERAKADDEAKRALSDEEFAAQEGTTWDEYQSEAYWRAYEALQTATPPDAKALAYQMRETLATTAFTYTWQSPDCRRTLSDLFLEGGETEVLIRTYQAVLRMAGETDHVAFTARATPAFIPPNDPNADIQGAWVRHHELFEAIEAAGVDAREQFMAFEWARYRRRWSAADVQALHKAVGRNLRLEDFKPVEAAKAREQAKVAA